MKLTFVYLPLFERTAEGVLGDEEMQAVEQQLLDNPRAGDVEAGTGGVRKLRVALPGRGKSGSARLIYLYIGARGKIYFIMVYPKSRKASLTDAEKKAVRALVKQLKEEP